MTKLRHLELGDLTPEVERNDLGEIFLKAKSPLAEYPKSILERLEYWSVKTPNALFLAQRNREDQSKWVQLSYRDTWNQVRQIAASLNKYEISADAPLAILAGNSVEHALLGLAVMYLGAAYAPVSPQYALASGNFEKLKHVFGLITPSMVFVDDANKYGEAIAASLPNNVIIISLRGKLADRKCVSYHDLFGLKENLSIETRYRNIKSSDPAKLLFSSGSTGMPKAIVNTHKMLAANQQMIAQAHPFLATSPVLVDWLPWNHTFGGNHNFGIALYNGGSYYIDEGKPVSSLFEKTILNLREISPTAYYNVPKGFEMLVQYLRNDKQLCETFFKRLKMLFYAGAGISQPVWDELESLAIETCGERIMILTGLGCTETAPSALFTNSDKGFAGYIGLPLPGVKVKLKQVGQKTEACFSGDNVTPGYWRNESLTKAAFDQDGYYRTGDAVKFVDDSDPSKGLQFDGRISEDFKLNTGTWVSAGPLRAKFLNHFGDLVQDVVIVGRDRASVGAMVFPNYEACLSKAGLAQTEFTNKNAAKLLSNPCVTKIFSELLQSFSETSTGSATKVDRLILEALPPQPDKHEITDKGSLNSSAIQENRSAHIEKLYKSATSIDLIVI